MEVPGAAGGVKHRVIGGFRQVDWDKTWAVEVPYDVVAGDVVGLLDFAMQQEPSKEMYQIEALMGRGA